MYVCEFIYYYYVHKHVRVLCMCSHACEDYGNVSLIPSPVCMYAA